MAQYIDKDDLVAEIERLKTIYNDDENIHHIAKYNILVDILSFINILEVKEVDTWHLQEKEDIYDVVKDWGLYAFACIMKDGTIQRFNGCLDEDCEGHVHVHIDGVNDDYDNVDDIVKWIEIT